jgi:hypothetical protein
MKRTLLDGSEVLELDTAVELIVKTKCPNKYKLIDLETGEEYIGNMPDEHHRFWKKITNGY